MNVQGIREFFETLAPREILLYVFPGSVVIVEVLLIWGDPKLANLARYVADRASLSIIAVFVWGAAAYIIGLIIANICRVMPRKWKRGVGTYPPYYVDELMSLIRSHEVKSKLQEMAGRQAIIERLAYQYVRHHNPDICREEIARFGVFSSCARHLACTLMVCVIILSVAYAGHLHNAHWLLWWQVLLLLFVMAGLALILWRGGNIEQGRQSRRIAACFMALRMLESPTESKSSRQDSSTQ